MRVKTIRIALAAIGTVCLFSLFAAEPKFDKAEYLKAGTAKDKKGETIKGALAFDSVKKTMSLARADGSVAVSIPYDSIKSLLYERSSKPRYAEGILLAWPLLLTKSKKHYLTVQYTDATGQGQFAIFHLDKSNYQVILATAEAQTGKKVERSEEH